MFVLHFYLDHKKKLISVNMFLIIPSNCFTETHLKQRCERLCGIMLRPSAIN